MLLFVCGASHQIWMLGGGHTGAQCTHSDPDLTCSCCPQAVDVVGQAGKPKTITGFQTHTTPVLLAYGERAELATDECILDNHCFSTAPAVCKTLRALRLCRSRLSLLSGASRPMLRHNATLDSSGQGVGSFLLPNFSKCLGSALHPVDPVAYSEWQDIFKFQLDSVSAGSVC